MNNRRSKAGGGGGGVGTQDTMTGRLTVKPIGGEMTEKISPFFFQSLVS